jgi:hypothetical protein
MRTMQRAVSPEAVLKRGKNQNEKQPRLVFVLKNSLMYLPA